MKKSIKPIALLIIIAMAISSLPLCANAQQTYAEDILNANDTSSGYGTGDLSMKIKNPDNPTVISSVSDYLEVKSSKSSGGKDIAMTSASSLPNAIDNSASPYFPEISSQGTQGSCVSFACAYYQFTYEMNKSRKVATTAQNSFSPKWAYNFLSHGTDTGTSYSEVYGILKQHGCPTLKSLPYDAKDYLSWSTDEKVWREAMRYRLADYQLFDGIGKNGKEITSADDTDLLAIKTSLANGDVLTCSTFYNSWETKKLKTNPNAPQNDKFLNEKYLRSMTGTKGDHRITIVGYNDELWCDINDNNQIDAGEMGALKIANSWGKTNGNNGFMWVSYDSLNDDSCVEGATDASTRQRVITDVTRIDVKPAKEGSDIYVKFTVNTANRSRFYAVFSASLHGTEYKRYLLDSARYVGNSDFYAFNGTTTACDATFVYPLDDLNPALTLDNFEDHDFNITIKDSASDSSTVIVKNASLVNEYTGKEYRVNANYPITLNSSEWNATLKEKTTSNAVIYYIGFDEPNMHYKKSGASTFTKVKMEKNDERHGYQYKYVLEDINSDVKIYFSDDSGKVDNNNGNYHIAKNGLNYYFTKGQREELKISDLKISNGTPDIGKRCRLDFKTTGGYEPYKYKYTIEDLNTGDIRTVNYTGIYENDPFKYERETRYKLTVEAMDYAKQTTSTCIVFDVEDQPFVIDSLTASKENGIVSKELTFSSITAFEGLMSGPHKPQTHFVIKDSNGKVWYDEIVQYKTSNYSICSTTTEMKFTPQKAGKYTITASVTDWNKDYAQKTESFTVYDMIYGDSDGNGTVNIMDATTIQRSLVGLIDENDFYEEMSDCDESSDVNIMDATSIQRYLVNSDGTGKVGSLVDYVPSTEPPATEPSTAESTQKPTTTPSGNQVTFTNSLNWSGTMYCYYWSDSNTAMTSWPGKAMTKSGTNEYGETLYTFDVPKDAKYIIFNNNSNQTVDISYPGGNVKYYPLNSKNGNGYNVSTW